MPTLDWLNRSAAFTTAAQVPYRLLDTVSTYGNATQAQQNLLIQGDNLQALKALLPFYRGKVKCIFIDPPYNTQSAFEHYDDNLEHSQWLSMMLPRLQLLRELLSEDGSIWVTIDDNEGHYLKVLMDEVFGRRNFLTTFIWQKSYGGGAKARYFVGLHEYIHCFAKNIAALPDFFWPPDEGVLKYYKLRDAKFAIRGPYRLQPLATTSNDERPNLRYALPGPDGTEVWPVKQWQWSQERALNALANDELVFTPSKTGFTVNYKQYLRDADGEERRAKPKSIIAGQYTQHGTQESVALFGQEKKFSFPKPEGIIERILEAATTPGDLVLDSFLGSGTTAAVAHKMGRRWIGIEMGEHAATHCLPRLEKVIAGEQGGISQAVGWQGGGGFRYFRLAPSLLEKDKWGNWVINKEYNAAMLAEALCKLEGFSYAPSETIYWQHGHSTERDFLYVTTANLNHEQLQELADEVGPERSLLVLCTAFRAKANAYPNLTIKKIPKQVLSRCEWGHDDYSLKVENLPKAPPKPGQQALFGEEEGR